MSLNHGFLVFVVLFFVVGFSACGTVRSVQSSQTAESSFRHTGTDSALISRCVKQQMQAFLTKNAERLLRQNIVIDKETLSAPDSLGRQFPVEKMKVTVHTRVDEAERRIDSVSVVSEEQVDSTAYRHHEGNGESFTSSASAEKRGLSWWHKCLMIFGIAAVFYLVEKIRQCKL